MTRVSTKFGAALIVLLGAAAATRLTVLGGAGGTDVCAMPDALKATSLIPGATALGERLEALDASTFQWSEGEVALAALPSLPMEFQIVRSYDAPALYNNPLRFGSLPGNATSGQPSAEPPEPSRERLQPEALGVREAEVAGMRLPIHVAWDHTDARASRLVAWFFVFDNRPVRSPLAAQLRNSLGLAFGGPRPLTLVTLSAVAPPLMSDEIEDAAAEWLSGAWGYIARTCTPR